MNWKHLILTGLVAMATLAAEQGASKSVKWTVKDVTGTEVNVPADRPSVISFVRPDQPQSKQSLDAIKATAKDAQVIVVLSGPAAIQRAVQLASDLPAEWRVVADTEFAASGQMHVHVWPTTLIVKPDGTQVAHLAGSSKTSAIELPAYLAYAAGQIDEATLQQRLTTREIITDSPQQAAARHLQVGMRLLEDGKADEARAELLLGLKISPQDPALQVTCARAFVLVNQPSEAIALLDRIPAGAVPGWQVNLVRGRALIALGKWAEAKSLLPDAVKLNPNPAEAHYLLGICLQQEKDFIGAANEFRAAFERTAGNHKLIVPAK